MIGQAMGGASPARLSPTGMGIWEMHGLGRHAIVASMIVVMATPCLAASEMPGMVLLHDDQAASWGPPPASLPKGLLFSILSGDPSKPGPFTLRIRLPANFVIAPHTHATSENLTVLSGAIVHDMGNTLVRSRGKPLATGGFVFLPGDTPHALWTNGAPAEIQVTGTGPFGLHYINPADDPRNAH